jgi:hypothetical protein
MRTLKRLSMPVEKKHPMTPDMLRWFFRRLDLSQSGHQLLWGLFLIGYFLLRRGEFLKDDGKWESYVLRYGDIQDYDRNEVVCRSKNAAMSVLTLRGGKNNQYGRNEIYISTRPVTLYSARCEDWPRYVWPDECTKRSRGREPVTKISKDHGFGNGHIIQVLKQISKDMDLDDRNYSTHSIRIGGSTALLNTGA